MSAICIFLGSFCMLYYLFLVIHAGIMLDFGWFWAAAGVSLLLAAYLHRIQGSALALWVSRLMMAALAAGLVLLGIAGSFVIRQMRQPLPGDIDCAVVLGAQVKGKKPSLALSQRLQAALETAEKYPSIPLILSGGQGQGEHITEAECMRNYLVENGVGETRLLLEDKSTTTRENLLFSDGLYGCAGKRCAVISNDFHICRALLIAKSAGYKDVSGVAAKGEPLMEPHYIVRESAALLYGKLRGMF